MAQGRLITIGSFDGVHLGHAALLDFTVAAAKKRRVKSMALTFEVPPKIVLNQESSKLLLSDLTEKEFLIRKHGIDQVRALQFDDKLSRLKPFHFFRDLLIRTYNARGVVVGADFRFGADRTAGAVELVQWGGEFEIPVWVIPPVRLNRTVISSSFIRGMLAANRLQPANRLLGHPYLIGGRVVKGSAKGRELGFPTANLEISEEKLVPKGVFVVTGTIIYNLQKKKPFKGVANIGVRPTLFSSSPVSVEIHLFGNHPNLVGKRLMVDLRYRLRDEKKFSSPAELIQAIRRDVKRGREWLARRGQMAYNPGFPNRKKLEEPYDFQRKKIRRGRAV